MITALTVAAFVLLAVALVLTVTTLVSLHRMRARRADEPATLEGGQSHMRSRKGGEDMGWKN